MEVRATKQAFYDGSLVEPGQLVEVPQGFKASWAAPADQVPVTKPGKGQRQQTLSQVASAPTQTFVQAMGGDKANPPAGNADEPPLA